MSGIAFLAAVIGALLSGAAQADDFTNQARRRCVDTVALRGGVELRGSVVARDENGLTMAVSRDWLQQHEARYYDAHREAELAAQRSAYELLVQRIESWLADVPDGSDLHPILLGELEEYRALLADPAALTERDASQFLLAELPADRVRRVFIAPSADKKLALFGWFENLLNVEEATPEQLREVLVEAGVEDLRAEVNLADRLPRGLPQSEREWAARRAIYEYAFEDRVEFQGSGDFVVRTGGQDDRPELSQVLGGLLRQQLAGDLADLLNGGAGAAAERPPGWMDTAAQAADEAGASGFRVTRLELDVGRNTVRVESRFVAKLAADSWETIWRRVESADPTERRENLEERIRNDPQVSESLDLLQSLGQDAAVDQALRTAAATMHAQQEIDDRFWEFRDRYTRRLDSPPLRWMTVTAAD